MGAKEGNTNGFPKSGSLCWECQNAVPDRIRGCNWSRHLKPVEGWTAVTTDRNNQQSKCVIDCPEFVPDSEPEPVNPGVAEATKDALIAKARRYESRARTEYLYGNTKSADGLMEKSKKCRIDARQWDGLIHFEDEYERHTFLAGQFGL